MPEKGADQAIEAISRPLTMGRPASAHLAIVGDGPRRSDLERFAADVANTYVSFHGSLSSLLSAYHAADVVVLPSRGGNSMLATLIEAGFCAPPSLTTPIGSITDVVLKELTGLVVPPDDVDALVAALCRLASEPGFAERLGNEAQVHCRANFETDVVARQWIEVLEDVVRTEATERTTIVTPRPDSWRACSLGSLAPAVSPSPRFGPARPVRSDDVWLTGSSE